MQPLIHNRKKRIALIVVNAVIWMLWLPQRLFQKRLGVANINPKKILLIRLDYIGDVVMTSPCFSYLKVRFPKADLHLLTNPAAASLYKNDPVITSVHIFDWPWPQLRTNNKFSLAKLVELWKLTRSLKRAHFDLAIDFRGDIRFVLLFGVLTKAKIRLSNSRSGNSTLLHHVSHYDVSKHEVERTFDVIRCLGQEPVEINPYIPIAEQDMVKARALVREVTGSPFPAEAVILAPYSSKDIKSWPVEYFKEVISYLVAHNYQVFIVGAKGDRESAVALAGGFGQNVYSLAGLTSLVQLAGMVKQARLVVGVDTGVLHIASCFKTPIVAVFGPTRSCEYRPYSRLSVVADSKSCVCDQTTHAKCDVPVGGYAKCMFNLTPRAVLTAIENARQL